LATGIASFGSISGVHYQNVPEWEAYCTAIEAGQLPLLRGLPLTPHQALIRETILQLKHGQLDRNYFRTKFNVDIAEHWRDVWTRYEQVGYATVNQDRIVLSRPGLLQVDGLLPAFFEPEHRAVRYT